MVHTPFLFYFYVMILVDYYRVFTTQHLDGCRLCLLLSFYLELVVKIYSAMAVNDSCFLHNFQECLVNHIEGSYYLAFTVLEDSHRDHCVSMHQTASVRSICSSSPATVLVSLSEVRLFFFHLELVRIIF